jgi:hypothetical protein
MDDEAEDKPKRISKGVLQLNFMRKTHNQIIAKEKKKKQQIDQTNQIYPTVLKPDDDPIM